MNKKIKIGIDIDEVIVEFLKSYLDFYNERFGKKMKWGDISEYFIWNLTDISKKEALNLANKFYDSKHFDNLEFVAGAKESVMDLQEKYHIHFITSRPKDIKQKTMDFFNFHFPENGYEFIFSEDLFGGKRTKANICNELGINLLIEDNPDYAIDCAEKGIKIFLLNKPWNQDYQKHENILKVNDWREIMGVLG